MSGAKLGKAFSPVENFAPDLSDRDERKKLEVQRKLKELADNDLRINGCYANAPYKVIIEGERFTGKPKRVQVVTKYVLSITGRSNYAVPRQDEFTSVEIDDPLNPRTN